VIKIKFGEYLQQKVIQLALIDLIKCLEESGDKELMLLIVIIQETTGYTKITILLGELSQDLYSMLISKVMI
jgi:hypothetical protein